MFSLHGPASGAPSQEGRNPSGLPKKLFTSEVCNMHSEFHGLTLDRIRHLNPVIAP